MQHLFTISAYQTTAQAFFQRLLREKTTLVLDIRLKNRSQLCGFTKEGDLAYFVKTICHADYVHDPRFTPQPELLERYRKHWIPWETYAAEYRNAMQAQGADAYFQAQYGAYPSVALLGTATAGRRSHSEVLCRLLSQQAPKNSSVR